MKNLALQCASGDTKESKVTAAKIFQKLLEEECFKNEVNYAMNGGEMVKAYFTLKMTMEDYAGAIEVAKMH